MKKYLIDLGSSLFLQRHSSPSPGSKLQPDPSQLSLQVYFVPFSYALLIYFFHVLVFSTLPWVFFFLLTSSFLVVCYNTAGFTGRRRGTTRETGPWPSTAIKEEHRTTSRIRSPVRKTTKASWNRLLRYIWQWKDKSDLVYAVKILECFRVKIVSKNS